MLKEIGAAALKDIIGMLKEEKLFFEAVDDTRLAVIKKHLPDFPEVFIHYLSHVNEDEYLKDMENAIQFLNDSGAKPASDFLGALARYIAEEIGFALDHLTADFFFEAPSERLARLEALLPGNSVLAGYVRQLFAGSTYQEITQMAYKALNQMRTIPVIVIQTPIAIKASERQVMRQSFLEKYPHSFPEFQINPQIIGGMRVFVNGVVEDQSWLAKVQALTRLAK